MLSSSCFISALASSFILPSPLHMMGAGLSQLLSLISLYIPWSQKGVVSIRTAPKNGTHWVKMHWTKLPMDNWRAGQKLCHYVLVKSHWLFMSSVCSHWLVPYSERSAHMLPWLLILNVSSEMGHSVVVWRSNVRSQLWWTIQWKEERTSQKELRQCRQDNW